MKAQITLTDSKVSTVSCLGRGPRICIFGGSAGDVNAPGQGATLCESLVERRFCSLAGCVRIPCLQLDPGSHASVSGFALFCS